MNKNQKAVIGFIIGLAIGYFVWSFICGEFNPMRWGMMEKSELRESFMGLARIMGVFVITGIGVLFGWMSKEYWK